MDGITIHRTGLLTATLGAALGAQSQVLDLHPTNASDPELTAMGDQLFLCATTGSGRFLQRYDTATGQLDLVFEATTGAPVVQAHNATVVGARLFFTGTPNGSTSPGLYVVMPGPGTLTATRLTALGSDPQFLTAVGDRLYFNATSLADGHELWTSDGTAAGTRSFTIRPGAGDGAPQLLTAYGGLLVFRANDGSHGQEPWICDGTSVRLLADVHPSGASAPADFTVAGSFCWFSATNGSHGRELWRTDGVTTTLIDIRTGTAASDPSDFADFGGTLYFAANGGNGAGRELWQTTAGGAAMVVDLRTGTASSTPTALRRVGSLLYFSADFNASSRFLYAFDPAGSVTGANPRIVPAMVGGTPVALEVRQDPQIGPLGAGDAIAFAGRTSSGFEPFVSNGVDARQIEDIHASGSSDPEQFTVAGGELFFAAGDGGPIFREPWHRALASLGVATWRPLGSACPRANGIAPVLGLDAPPRLGATIHATVDGAVPGGLVFHGLASAATEQTLGGCTLWLDNGKVFASAGCDAAGHSSLRIDVPATPALMGWRVFLQSLAAENGGPALGLGALTNAIDLVLGG